MPVLKHEIVDQFIIEVKLIDPIKDIISKLENREFRDCDISWLDNKLDDFIEFAAKTMGFTSIKQAPRELYPYMNKFVKDRFLKYFTGLLTYFEKL
jgi:hypothetical protein